MQIKHCRVLIFIIVFSVCIYCRSEKSENGSVSTNAIVAAMRRSAAPWGVLDVLQLIGSNRLEIAQQRAETLHFDLIPQGDTISNALAANDFQSAEKYMNRAIDTWIISESAHSQCHQYHVLLCSSNNLSFLKSLATYRETYFQEDEASVGQEAVQPYIHSILTKAVEKKSAECNFGE